MGRSARTSLPSRGGASQARSLRMIALVLVVIGLGEIFFLLLAVELRLLRVGLQALLRASGRHGDVAVTSFPASPARAP